MDDGRRLVMESSPALSYGQIEAAIGGVFGVKPSAIRARVRHLRRHHIPQGLSEPGSGNSISYSVEQALEMMFAVALESVGVKPMFIGPTRAADTPGFAVDSPGLAARIVTMWQRHERTPDEKAAGELIVVLYPAITSPSLFDEFTDPNLRRWAEKFGAIGMMDMRGIDQLTTVITRRLVPPIYATVEVSRLAVKFIADLEKMVSASK